jgi:hypothetical protein
MTLKCSPIKALARSQKQSTTKKSKYPLGNPVDLIPNDIITAARLQDAIDAINKEPAPGRYREFTKVTTEGTITHAVLYELIKRFEFQVQKSIPQWEDSRTMFGRIKDYMYCRSCLQIVTRRDTG